MSANDELLEILKDALGRIGRVSGRRMFGGVGVYLDGIFFALIDDGAIYLKTSDETRPAFEVERSRAFSYMNEDWPGRAALQLGASRAALGRHRRVARLDSRVGRGRPRRGA